MRVEFRQGVPAGCVEWLRANVGAGNIYIDTFHGETAWPPSDEFDSWFYERITKLVNPQPFGDDSVEYIPTITVKDEKLAVLFILRWS